MCHTVVVGEALVGQECGVVECIGQDSAVGGGEATGDGRRHRAGERHRTRGLHHQELQQKNKCSGYIVDLEGFFGVMEFRP